MMKSRKSRRRIVSRSRLLNALRGNKFVCGSTRSGKSVAETIDIVSAAMAGNIAIVVCDPHKRSLAWNALLQLVARHQTDRIIFDSLTTFGRVPGYEFLPCSKSRNKWRRESQDEQTAKAFAEILCRRGNRGPLSSAPLTEEWTYKAVRLLLSQPHDHPASDLRFALQPSHPVFKRLVISCRESILKNEFEQVLSGKIGRGQYAPALRLIEGVCGSPAFRARCGTSFKLGEFLDNCGILMLEGGEDGIAQEVVQTIMGSIVLQTIQYVRKRPKPFPRVLLVLDEATNANLVSDAEMRAMAECQKMGLDIHVLVQQLDFPSSDICNGVLSNSIRHEWFYNANPNVLRKAADDLGLSASCTYAMRSLKVGERYVKDRHLGREEVWKEQVEMLANPWVFPRLAAKKAFRALSDIRRRAEFQSPPLDENCESLPAIVDEAGPIISAAQRLQTLRRRQNDGKSKGSK